MAVFDIKLPKPSVALIDAINILQRLNDEIQHRIEVHKDTFRIFWFPTDGTTPDEIVEQMGNKAALFYALSQESVRHIKETLKISGLNQDDYLPLSSYIPPREVIINEDGTATLKPIPPAKPNDNIYVDNSEAGEELNVTEILP